MSEHKRRHHFVWRHYLEAWAPDGKLHATRGGKTFRPSPTNAAVAKDMYRIEELSPRELDFVRSFIRAMVPKDLQEDAWQLCGFTQNIFRVRARLRDAGKLTPDLERLVASQVQNRVEDLHAVVETDAVPILGELREGRVTFLGDDRMKTMFCAFLAMQFQRTPVMANAIAASIGNMDSGIDFPRCWGVLRVVLAYTMSQGLAYTLDKLAVTFLEVNEGTLRRFVTGDQPLFNLRADGVAAPAELAFYYPISPCRAVILDFDRPEANIATRTLSEDEVRRFNGQIALWSRGVVYGASGDDVSLAVEEAPKPPAGWIH